MRPNRPELAILRGKDTDQKLAVLIETFSQGDDVKSKRYANAFRNFIGIDNGVDQNYFGSLSIGTRKAYSRAIAEFFEWAAREHKRIIPPHEVTRDMARRYVDWLANRPFSLVAEKLQDGDRDVDFAIYSLVESLGEAKLQHIADQLPPHLLERFGADPQERYQQLSKHLGDLCRDWVLRRSPTMEELRQTHPQAGITLHVLNINGMETPLEDVYLYRVFSPEPLKRTTITARLYALSTLWNALMQGENQDDPNQDFVRFDIWLPLAKRVNKGTKTEKKQATREARLPPKAVLKMLRDAPTGTLIQLRDRAMVYLLALLGLRKSELQKLRRAPVPGQEKRMSFFMGGEPPQVSVVRKGSRRQQLPYPPAALEALIMFQTQLQQAIQAAKALLERGSPAARDRRQAQYLIQLSQPDAPLFPPLEFWGRNDARLEPKPLTPRAIDKSLKRVAESSGLTPEEVKKVHAHAFRHFAATAMLQGGKDLRAVQYILGHDSITTTEVYLEDVTDAVELSGQNAILNYASRISLDFDIPKPKSEPASQQPLPETQPETIVTEGVELEELNLQYDPTPVNRVPVAPPILLPPTIIREGDDGYQYAETKDGLVGIDGDPVPLEAVDDPTDERSAGTPDFVYEMYAAGAGADARTSTGPEIVAFTERRQTGDSVSLRLEGERGSDFYQGNVFLRDHYDPWPNNYGIGTQSLLPWFKRGQANKYGYVKGVPPLPVWSVEQAKPETDWGAPFIDAIHELYESFLEKSPIRAAGLLRWYQFFIYHAFRLDAYLGVQNAQRGGHIPTWAPYDSVVEVGAIRAHKDAWLLAWLRDNAHTYTTTRNVFGVRGIEEDPDVFWRATFEGVDLITDLPEWLTYDDPIKVLSKNPDEWKSFKGWLLNVTGQRLSKTRQEERKGQQGFATVEQQDKADKVRGILELFYESVDKVAELRKADAPRDVVAEAADDAKEMARNALYTYAFTVTGPDSVKGLPLYDESVSIQAFSARVGEVLDTAGAPNPNATKYREIPNRKKRIKKIVDDLFPNTPGLADPNYFKSSRLFDPKMFSFDEDQQTVFVDPSLVEELERKYQQNANLLARRSLRAMWDWVKQDLDKRATSSELKAIMLCYLSYIIPTGSQMETTARGRGTAADRLAWLRSFEETMRDLAQGDLMQRLGRRHQNLDSPEAREDAAQQTRARSIDAYDRAQLAVDFTALQHITDEAVLDPEEALLLKEQARLEEAPGRRKRKLLRNATPKGEYVHVEGEEPLVWFQVDLGGRRGYRRNGPAKYMSLGAFKRVQEQLAPAQDLLPTPFEMLRAMSAMP